MNVQGYTQGMRLQRRLFGIFFPIFMVCGIVIVLHCFFFVKLATLYLQCHIQRIAGRR